MANKWFEEKFLPSLEQRMNNPKYPNSCILTDKQFEVCTRYMEAQGCWDSDYRKAFTVWKYQIGRTKYMVWQKGRYFFLDRVQNVGIHYVRDYKNDVILATFETEEEYLKWYDENVDTENYTITGKNGEILKRHQWTVGRF